MINFKGNPEAQALYEVRINKFKVVHKFDKNKIMLENIYSFNSDDSQIELTGDFLGPKHIDATKAKIILIEDSGCSLFDLAPEKDKYDPKPQYCIPPLMFGSVELLKDSNIMRFSVTIHPSIFHRLIFSWEDCGFNYFIAVGKTLRRRKSMLYAMDIERMI